MPVEASNRDPFPSRGLDNYFFATPALRLRLDIVQECVRRHDSPVLILGESGAGKSAVLNDVVCRSDNNWRLEESCLACG